MGKKKVYAVKAGRQTGIFKTWTETESQVKGYPGAQYKSFATLAEANAYLAGSTASSASRPKSSKDSRMTPPAGPVDITVYTDGGSRNTGNVANGHVKSTDKAAWAYRIELPDQVISDSAGEFGATNNRMEIMAVVEALKKLTALGKSDAAIQLVMDSRYVLNALTKGWLAGWKKRGWKRSSGPLINAELWQELDAQLLQFPHLSYQWTKGHATNRGNVYVDELLNQTMDQMGVSKPVPPKPTVEAPASSPANQKSVEDVKAALKKMGF
ncbi:ribonuclease H family protein [Levilactobacillus bambusae]|uniref:Ribonuclease H n=1 Tax=Levilactobacillus bambusae TaxID=2024736 RepID=A0A2V1MZD5_9LACO|nr:ribonuclease H family protein [Levilactobacillus bambusae]PWG00123.1 ribonuclease [Levilactobacillus bambusae]